tara:strand:- start:9 stop:980 length:972 start_codon:yes stop_codon:yes gene_type:complete
MAIDYQSKRRFKNFQVRKVRESLPEYFTSEFPTLVTFLEKYYDFLDSADANHSFGDDLKQVFATKDIGEMPQELLNNYVNELAANLETGGNFSDTRFALRRLAQFLRLKGSRFSAEEFFRLFFQNKAEVVYGKESIFNIGDSASTIGTESLKFIQNNALFQTFGLQLKVPIDVSKWNELYKKFVHPAGFYYEGQVVSDAEASLSLTAPLSIPLDSAATAGPSITSEALLGFNIPFVQETILLDSDGANIRVGLNQLVSVYQSLTTTELQKFYSSIDELIGVNSFTFDDSDIRDSAGGSTPDFSLATETMDNDMFTRYLSDSAF